MQDIICDKIHTRKFWTWLLEVKKGISDLQKPFFQLILGKR